MQGLLAFSETIVGQCKFFVTVGEANHSIAIFWQKRQALIRWRHFAIRVEGLVPNAITTISHSFLLKRATASVRKRLPITASG